MLHLQMQRGLKLLQKHEDGFLRSRDASLCVEGVKYHSSLCKERAVF